MNNKIVILTQSIYKFQNYNRVIEIAKSLKKYDYDILILTTSPKRSILRQTTFDDKIKIVLSPEFLPIKFKIGQLGVLDTLYRTFFCISNNFDIYYFEGHKPTIFIPFIFTKIFKKRKFFINEWMDWFGNEGRSCLNPIVFYDRLFQVLIRKFFNYTIVISKYLYRLLKLKGLDNIYYLPSGTRPKINIYKQRIKKTNEESQKYVNVCIVKIDKDDINDFLFALDSLKVLSKEVNIKINVFITSKLNLSSIIQKYSNLRQNLILKHIGYVEDYWGFLASMDIALLPFSKTRKNFAKFPNKFNDFISIGLPTVFHPTGELLYLWQKFNFETVDRYYNINNFSKIMRRLINNKEFYFQESTKAFEASLKLDWDKKIEKLAGQLKYVIEN